MPFPNAPGISRILLDPTDPKHIVVGVLGDVFAPSAQRGVYVSFDGGATFAKTLYLSDQSGASDMAMDPKKPERHLRRNVARSAPPVVDHQRRYDRRRALPFRTTAEDVEGSDRQRVPGSADRPHRCGNRSVAAESHLRARRVDGRRALALRRLAASPGSSSATTRWPTSVRFTSRTCAFRRPTPAPSTASACLLTTSYNGGEKFNLSAFGVHSDSARHVDLVGRQPHGAGRRRRDCDLGQRRRDVVELAQHRDRSSLSRRASRTRFRI